MRWARVGHDKGDILLYLEIQKVPFLLHVTWHSKDSLPLLIPRVEPLTGRTFGKPRERG